METPYPYEQFDALVGKVLQIEDIILGSTQSVFLVRYRGRLKGESEAAHNQLAGWLKPYQITPLFRWEGDRHAILLTPELPKPVPANPMRNLGLVLLTFVSMVLIGGLSSADQSSLPTDPLQAMLQLTRRGAPFAVALMSILICHEFGHFFMARHHGVPVSLPFFIPFPIPGFSPFGTLGAFINMGAAPKNRKAMLDIAIAGPFCGLVMAVPILLWGLSQPQPTPLTTSPGRLLLLEGNSVLYLLAKFAEFGPALPPAASFAGPDLLLYPLRNFFSGTPLPIGVPVVSLHPLAWAGWAGLLMTNLNLTPAGYIDGGHVAQSVFGRERAERMLPFILGALLLFGFLWIGWWLWAALIYFQRHEYAEPLDQITPINNPRKALAALAFIFFCLTFVPIPFVLLSI